METTFYITLTMKTPDGYAVCGKFFLGKDRSFAYEVFAGLQGSEVQPGADLLCMDLMELNDGLPLNLLMRTCNLEQLSYNCGLIAKELFKEYNLKET